MHIAKRIVSIFLVLLICVLVVGCGDDSEQTYTSERKLAEKESKADTNVKPDVILKSTKELNYNKIVKNFNQNQV